jgi:hypothetical protein
MKRILLALILVTACHRTTPARYELVNRGLYAYQRLNEGELVVAAVTDRDLKQALVEIGCGSKYICRIEPQGELVMVWQRLKTDEKQRTAPIPNP